MCLNFQRADVFLIFCVDRESVFTEARIEIGFEKTVRFELRTFKKKQPEYLGVIMGFQFD